MKRSSEIFMIICFLGFVILSMAATLLRTPDVYSYYENRLLASFPEYSPEAVGEGSYTTQLELYLDDHAALRNTLLRCKALGDLALRRPVVNDVVVTPERLLPFISVGPANYELITEQAQAMADRLEDISNTVEEYGGYYCYVAVPSQSAYFEDEYPWYINNGSEYCKWAVSILSQMLEQRGVEFLDIQAGYNELGHPDGYFSSVDHHYTMDGTFEAYRLIMERISADTCLEFPVLGSEDVYFETLDVDYLGSRERMLINLETREEKPSILHPLEEIPYTRMDNGVEKESEVYCMELSLDGFITYNLYMGGDIANTVIDTHREELPSILIYGDSFTNALECVAYLSFDEMHSIDLRSYEEMSLEDYIRQLRPEVVVCIRDYSVLLSLAGNGGG